MLPLRAFYFILGWIFFGVGLVGVFLPVLPTTPFMLLALWMFSKSSDKFHNWLYSHHLFGPPLVKWTEYRVIPPVAKIFALVMMLMSYMYIMLYLTVPLWGELLIALLLLFTAYYILSKPSYAPDR